MTCFEKNFEVLQILDGKFCEIVKCKNKRNGKMYVAKRFKEICKKKVNIKKCPEVVLLERLAAHKNIYMLLEHLYDTFTEKVTFIYDVFDTNLKSILESKKYFSEIMAKNYLLQMLEGLEHLHKNGFFHRNINPKNILVNLVSNDITGNENVKLAGLESIRGIYSDPPYTDNVNNCRYRAPESILTTGFYGSKVDIWALGCIFYEILTLKQLFPGTSSIDQLQKIHHVLGTPKVIANMRTKPLMPVFKKIKGVGIDHLLPEVSIKGRNILKSMIEYEPNLRTNVKRLIKNPYFTEKFTDRYKGRCSPEQWLKPFHVLKTNIR